MTSVLGEVLRNMFGKKREQKVAHFKLEYVPAGGDHVTVGFLTLESDGRWAFTYDAEYRRRSDLRPIEGFDDLYRTYRSKVLFPFFAVRIPDLQRADVRKRLGDIRDPDATDLLRRFGRRSAASPAFELVET